MEQPPTQPKIYHITHLSNLAQIVATSGLWSDAGRIERGLDCKIVGMSEIKRRRLEELEVGCHPATKIGQYVPFYFCLRSIIRDGCRTDPHQTSMRYRSYCPSGLDSY